MATDKPKIQGYVGQSTWKAFQEYQLGHRLSQSQALDALLIKALEISNDGAKNVTSQQFTKDLDTRLESLERKQHDDYCRLKDLVLGLESKISSLEIGLEAYSQVNAEYIGKIRSQLKSLDNPPSDPTPTESNLGGNLPSNSPSDPLVTEADLDSNPPSDLDSNLPNDPLIAELLTKSDPDSNPPSDPLKSEADLDSNPPSNLPMTELELESDPTSNLPSDLDSDLLSDPLVIENDLSSNLPSDLNSNLPSKSWEKLRLGLSEGELFDRLGVARNTLAKHRNQGSLAEWSKTKDPDGIAWRFENKLKLRYYPIAE